MQEIAMHDAGHTSVQEVLAGEAEEEPAIGGINADAVIRSK